MFAVLCTLRLAAGGPWDPPAGYYESATATGEVLNRQLADLMSAEHIQRRYGDFKQSAAIHDQDPDRPGNILLVYSRDSVPASWDAGHTWSRQHLWPPSRQPEANLSDSTRGHLSDPHALRPVDPQISSSRSNTPFGSDPTTGDFRREDGYWFPGDADKGDVARAMFYSDTRWSHLGISLTDADVSDYEMYEMGDLSSLVAWHYLDPPDDFERRRNHTIYSQELNPQYYTNNRNAFVDHPEFVWSVYVDQENDSRLTIDGATVFDDGTSVLDLQFAPIIVGAPSQAARSVTLRKTGQDGTYYQVAADGEAFSSLAGRFNAFRSDGPDSTTFDVGLSADSMTAGLHGGRVMIDNLDVTAEGGLGRGANDGNDVINLNLSILDHATPSFADDGLMSSWICDFGTAARGTAVRSCAFDVFNLATHSRLHGIPGAGQRSWQREHVYAEQRTSRLS